MNYIFVSSDINYGSSTIKADWLAKELLSKSVWFLREHSANTRRIDVGDRVVFYLAGGGNKTFIGEGLVERSPEKLGKKELALVQVLGLKRFVYHIKLKDIVLWKHPVEIEPIIGSLSFIRNKQYWGLSLRMGTVRIGDEDLDKIRSAI